MTFYSTDSSNAQQSFFLFQYSRKDDQHITIKNEKWSITKQVIFKHNQAEYEHPFQNVPFKLGIRLENFTIIVASLLNGTARTVESWECGEKMCKAFTCEDSQLNFTKAHPCGSNINWCPKFHNDLQWIWESPLPSNTSHIWCRNITGRW